MQVRASVSFSGDHTTVGRERIRLLAAVGREGSISAAARSVGLSYKAAWDAIDGMNDLFGQKLVETRSGGRRGGGARLTGPGIQVIEALSRLESELTLLLRRLDPAVTQSGLSLAGPSSDFVLRTSARNALRGVITAINTDAVSAQVAVQIARQSTIYATITQESVRELALVEGRAVLALLKASLVSILMPEEPEGKLSRNHLMARILRVERSRANTEYYLDVGAGKTLVASIATRAGRGLTFKTGDRVCAKFDSRNVVLAID
jgi:molybdate transport system regulatory protein